MNSSTYFCHRLFAAAMLAAMFAARPSLGEESGVIVDYDTLAISIDEMSKKLQALRGEIDQTRFDPDQLLGALDYDSQEVLTAVSAQIAFQPYPGVLRGVAGTLRAGAGNSVDQALLLAYLLKSAGYDARIVRGALSDDEAARLLSTVNIAASRDSLVYLEPFMKTQFGEQSVRVPSAMSWGETELYQQSSAVADSLVKALSSAGITFEADDVTAKTLAYTRSYFWVQHRDGPNDDWSNAHPAFGTHTPPTDLAAKEFFVESIPAKYQHRLTVRAVLAQRRMDKLTLHQLMTPLTRPVANLHGVVLNYRNHPDGLNLETLADVESAVRSTQFLMPMFNGAVAPGAMAFDLKGRVVDSMALGSGGAAGLFATLSDRMAEATGTVTDPDDPVSVFSLDSMWLEFSFDSPDGTDISYRRYVLPPRRGESSSVTELLWPLITDHTYLVNTGRQPLDYLADQYLQAGIVGNDWYKALIHKYTQPGKGTLMPRDPPPQDFIPLSQYQLMDTDPSGSMNIVTYRATPSLLGIRRGYRDANTAFIGVDIVANEMAHVRYENGKLWQERRAAFRRGVWDTSVESVPGRSMNLETLRTANAIDVFRAASEQNIETIVISPKQDAILEDLGLTAEAARSMRDDLTNGYTIAVPARTPDDVPMTGWWRIQPETGETLGMTADGYGQSVVEYLIEITNTAFGMVQALNSLKACDAQTNNVAKMCCLIEANINNIAGLGLGGLIGSTVGAAGGALFSIVDYGTQAATAAAFGESQGLMPQASLGCEQMQATDW
jgi:hypothetical protein